MFKRVILKLSGEALAGDIDSNRHYDEKAVDGIVSEISAVMRRGVQAAVVVGGGNLWRGRDARPDMNKAHAHQIGMIGTCMNGLYLREVFEISGAKAVVMTPFELNNFTVRFNRELALEFMENGVVAIFAGGTAHPFFSTDSITAIRACELEVDAVLYGKSVDGVYTCDPRVNPGARKYRTVTYATVVSGGLGAADISAVDLTRSQGIPSVVFELLRPGAIEKVCAGGGEMFEAGATLIANDIPETFYD